MQAPVVVAAALAVQATELVQPDLSLVAVAGSQLQDVQVLRQGMARRQRIPDLEQLQDDFAGGRGIARVSLATGQGLLILAAGRLLPFAQEAPVEAVEVPDAALRPL